MAQRAKPDMRTLGNQKPIAGEEKVPAEGSFANRNRHAASREGSARLFQMGYGSPHPEFDGLRPERRSRYFGAPGEKR